MLAQLPNHVPTQVPEHMPEVWPPISDLRSPISVSDLRLVVPSLARPYVLPPLSFFEGKAAQASPARPSMTTKHASTQATASTIAKVIHTLLAGEHFDSLADLTEALKWRLARLHVHWTNDDISTAYRLVATARRLPGIDLPRRTVHVEREPDSTISRAEAAEILEQLGIIL
jgi:hypothetical protein